MLPRFVGEASREPRLLTRDGGRGAESYVVHASRLLFVRRLALRYVLRRCLFFVSASCARIARYKCNSCLAFQFIGNPTSSDRLEVLFHVRLSNTVEVRRSEYNVKTVKE